MTDVFISYSRSNLDFVMQLRKALGVYRAEDDSSRDLDIWVDLEDIEYSVDWWERIVKGIEETNNFLVLISADYLASDVCNAELEYARANNKKIIPIIVQSVNTDEFEKKLANRDWKRGEKSLAHRQWNHLQTLNWINFESIGFDAGYTALLDAITTDVAHKDYHTQLSRRALQWERRDHPISLLLIGDEIDHAEQWLTEAILKEPEPTYLQANYIRSSREVQRQQQRLRFISVIGALIVAITLAGLSFILYTQSNERLEIANNRGTSVAQQASTATVAQGNALIAQTTSERRADESQSRVLAFAAQQAFANGDPVDALAYAFAAVEIPNPPILAQRTLADIAYGATPRQAIDIDKQTAMFVRYIPRTDIVLAGLLNSSVLKWDTASGEITEKIDGPAGSLVGLSNDGAAAFTNGSDNTLYIWETESGNVIQSFPELPFSPSYIVVNADNTKVLVGTLSRSSSVILLDVESGSELWRAKVEDGFGTRSGIFVPDDDVIIVGTIHWLYYFDAKTGEISRKIEKSFAADTFALHPDGNTLISAGSVNGDFYTWDVDTGAVSRELQAPEGVIALDYSSNGFLFATTIAGGELIIWDRLSELPLQNYSTELVYDVVFSPDHKAIVVAGTGGMELWDIDRSQYGVQKSFGNELGIDELALSPDGELLAIISMGIRIYDTTSGDLVRDFRSTPINTKSVVFSPDGQNLVSIGGDQLFLRNILSGELVDSYSSDGKSILSVAYDPNGEFVFIGLETGEILMWDTETGEVQDELVEHTRRITDIAISDDGRIGVSSSWDNTIIVWDLTNKQKKYTLTLLDNVEEIDISSDGKMALSSSRDQSMILWDLSSGESVRTLRGFTTQPNYVEFSPDDQTLLTRSNDEILLWDIDSGEILYKYHNLAGSRAIFGIDSATLITTHNPSVTNSTGALSIRHIWDIDALKRWTLKNRAVRELTCEEHRDFDMQPYCEKNESIPTRTPLPTATKHRISLTNTALPTVATFTPIPTSTPLPGPDELPFSVLMLHDTENYVEVFSRSSADAQNAMFVTVSGFEASLFWGDLAYTQAFNDESTQSTFSITHTMSPFDTLEEWSLSTGIDLPEISNIAGIDIGIFKLEKVESAQLAVFIYDDAFVVITSLGETSVETLAQSLLNGTDALEKP